MGSRVRFAAATCLAASGLLVGGVGGALAFAKPPLDSGIAEDDRTNSQSDVKAGETDPVRDKPRDEKPSDPEPGDGTPGDPTPGGEKPEDPGAGGEDVAGDGEGGGQDDGSTTTPEPTRTTDPPPPTKEPDPAQCGDKGEDDCGAGFPWWPFPIPFPFPWPPDPGEPGPVGDGSDGVPAGRPPGRLDLPAMRLPGELLPQTEPAAPTEPFDATPGGGAASAELPLEPIAMPVVVAPPVAFGGGPRPAPPEQVPASPRGQGETPAGRQPAPTDFGSNVTVPPASYRVGYTDYLRTAGLSQVVALAGPGLAGIVVLTGAGGFLGYRQAKAGHAVRASGTARFVN